MKRNELERLILLQRSGELSSRQERRLQKSLDSDLEARNLVDEIDAICAGAATTRSETRDDAAQLAAIKHAGEREIARKSKTHGTLNANFYRMWRPAIASAAAALILLTLSYVAWLNQPRQDGEKANGVAVLADADLKIEEQLTELEQEIDLAWLEYSEITDRDKGIKELAEEYLEIKEQEI